MKADAWTDSDFAALLKRHIDRRTGGRIQRLRAQAHGERVVVRGSAATYYALQLSLVAVREAVESVAAEHRREVQVAITVGARSPVFRAVWQRAVVFSERRRTIASSGAPEPLDDRCESSRAP